jgi:hypothetical protein
MTGSQWRLPTHCKGWTGPAHQPNKVPQIEVGGFGGLAALLGTVQEADLHQVRLHQVLQGAAVALAQGRRQGAHAHRAAPELDAQGLQVGPVQAFQAQVVHFVQGQAGVGDGRGDDALALHLGEIPAAPQQPVDDARRAPGAPGDGLGPFRGQFYVQHPGRAGGDDGQFSPGVVLQPVHQAEAVVQGLGDQPGPGGGAHQGEGPQVHLEGLGRGALADEDVQLPVLHGRVEHLLDGGGHPVDLVDEQKFPFIQVGEDGGQVALLFQGGGLDHLAGCPHLVGQDVGQGGLAQARGTEQEDVVQHFPSALGGAQGDLQPGLDLLLADILRKALGPQGVLEGLIPLLRVEIGVASLFHGAISSC